MRKSISGPVLTVATAIAVGTAVIAAASTQEARILGWNFGSTKDRSGPRIQVQGENGPSLSGMSAEFFITPADRGARIPACSSSAAPDPDCALKTAGLFCNGVGYAYVGSLAMQTVGDQVYLADVLCKHSVVAVTW